MLVVVAVAATACSGDDDTGTPSSAPTVAATAASTTAAPRPPLSTLPPTTITSLTGGDPERFCASIDATFPVVLVLGNDAAAAEVPSGEVALAPVLDRPLTDLVTASPVELVDPFRAWAERNTLALEAFETTGATDEQVTAYVAAVDRELEALQVGAADETAFADLAGLVAEFGIDRAALEAAAAGFVEANGTFDEFSLVLGRAVTVDPAVQDEIGERFPCVADAVSTGG